jgi:site-specific DNA-cytosine methylase
MVLRNADSRTLAEHLFMYLDELKPDYLYIENVREFMAWGNSVVPLVAQRLVEANADVLREKIMVA